MVKARMYLRFNRQKQCPQVFLEFAREQDDDRTGAKDNPIAEEMMENGDDHVTVQSSHNVYILLW